MAQISSAFHLSVWKAANLTRRMMVSSADVSDLDCDLLEQVYSWEPEEDIWGSLIDAEQTRKARAALVEAFDPSRAMADRGVAQLGKAVEVLAEIVKTPGATDWSECNEAAKMSNGEQVNLRANTVLLLFRHLEWIWNIFRHVPGASVIVR